MKCHLCLERLSRAARAWPRCCASPVRLHGAQPTSVRGRQAGTPAPAKVTIHLCGSVKPLLYAPVAFSRHLLLAAHLAVSREGLEVVFQAFLRREVADTARRQCPAFPNALQRTLPGGHPQGVRTEGAARRSEPRHAPTPTDAAATPNPKKSKNFLKRGSMLLPRLEHMATRVVAAAHGCTRSHSLFPDFPCDHPKLNLILHL